MLILLALLAGSGWLNLHLYVRLKTQPLREANRALDEALDKVNGIAERKIKDDQDTAKRFDRIATQSETALRRYAKAAGDNPLPPICAPGQARIDAINAGLGPQQ